MYINVWTFLEKKESSALVFSKLFTPKEVVTQMHEKSYLSKHLSSNPTHVLRNAVLSFHLFHFESNWVGETRFYWHLILEDSLLTRWLWMKRIFMLKGKTMVTIEMKLSGKQIFAVILLNFWIVH